MPARSYRHYPAEYAELFMRFRAEGSARIGPFTRPVAANVRRDLDRYRLAIRTAAEEDASDSYLRDLHETARDAVLRIVADDGDTFHVALALNPIVAAMRSPSPARSHGT